MRKIVLILVVLLGAALVYYYFNPGLGQHLPDFVRNNLPITAETTAYKWRDSDGNWQISEQPPAKAIPFETITVPHDTNVMPSQPVSGQK